jgi:hypothetical protein
MADKDRLRDVWQNYLDLEESIEGEDLGYTVAKNAFLKDLNDIFLEYDDEDYVESVEQFCENFKRNMP